MYVCSTSDGGSHLDGLKAAVTRTVNNVARKLGKLKESVPNVPGEFIREGLTAVVSVKVPDPEFEGQTKTRLGNQISLTLPKRTFPYLTFLYLPFTLFTLFYLTPPHLTSYLILHYLTIPYPTLPDLKLLYLSFPWLLSYITCNPT